MHSHCPLIDKSKYKYQSLPFKGTWQPTAMGLPIKPHTSQDYAATTIAFSTIHRLPTAYPMAGATYSDIHFPNDEACPERTLYVKPWTEGNERWIGEFSNQGRVDETPPIPLLFYNSIEGKELSGVTKFCEWDTATNEPKPVKPDWPWRIKVIYTGISWPVCGITYPDCIYMGLEENPTLPNHWVYNEVYARGVGLIDQWCGALHNDGVTVTGFQQMLESWSKS